MTNTYATIDEDVVLYEDGAGDRLVLRTDGNDGNCFDLVTQFFDDSPPEGENPNPLHEGEYKPGGAPTLSCDELIALGNRLVEIGKAKKYLDALINTPEKIPDLRREFKGEPR